MKRLAALLLLAVPLLGARWPTNVVNVTAASSGNSICNAADNDPIECCNNPAADTCDTELNGRDIAAGLNTCSAAGGCILQLPEGTFVEAEVDIAAGTSTTNGRAISDTAAGFPNGLIIQGKGAGTVLRSSIPPRALFGWSYILLFHVDRNMPGTEVPDIWIRNLTFDGQMNLQPSPNNAGVQFDDRGAAGSTHGGFGFFSNSTNHRKIRRFRVTNVQVEDFTSYSHSGDLGLTGGQSVILNSRFLRHGCHNDSGAVTGEIPCGCDSGSAGADCYGWESEADDAAWTVGTKAVGFALSMGIGAHDLVAFNKFSHSTKYGMQWFASTHWDGDHADNHPGNLGKGGRAHGNYFTKCETNAFNCNSCFYGWFSENTAFDNHLAGTLMNANNGVGTTSGTWSRWIRIENNTITQAGGAAIQTEILNSGDYPSVGVWIKGNTIDEPCDDVTNADLTNQLGAINLGIIGTAWTGQSVATMRNVLLQDNTITNNHCYYALATGASVFTGVINGFTLSGEDYDMGGDAASYPVADSGAGCGDGTDVACVSNVRNIVASDVTVRGGDWIWAASEGGAIAAQGRCSGFTLLGGATVINNGSVGTCP